MEKGYRAWGAEIGPDHSPLVAGLGWAVKLKSNTPFQGRAALEAQAAKKLPRLLAGFTTDPSIVLLGARPSIATASAWAGSRAAATAIRSAARSATAMSAIRRTVSIATMVLSGRYELEVATMRVPAEVFLDPLYDPTMSRIKS